MIPLIDRFFTKCGEPDVNGCIPWLAALTGEGYGAISLGSKTLAAHRVAWEIANGPILETLVIDHLCRNRACVNPDHMEPVTMAQNSRRGNLGSTVLDPRKIR